MQIHKLHTSLHACKIPVGAAPTEDWDALCCNMFHLPGRPRCAVHRRQQDLKLKLDLCNVSTASESACQSLALQGSATTVVSGKAMMYMA